MWVYYAGKSNHRTVVIIVIEILREDEMGRLGGRRIKRCLAFSGNTREQRHKGGKHTCLLPWLLTVISQNNRAAKISFMRIAIISDDMSSQLGSPLLLATRLNPNQWISLKANGHDTISCGTTRSPVNPLAMSALATSGTFSSNKRRVCRMSSLNVCLRRGASLWAYFFFVTNFYSWTKRNIISWVVANRMTNVSLKIETENEMYLTVVEIFEYKVSHGFDFRMIRKKYGSYIYKINFTFFICLI